MKKALVQKNKSVQKLKFRYSTILGVSPGYPQCNGTRIPEWSKRLEAPPQLWNDLTLCFYTQSSPMYKENPWRRQHVRYWHTMFEKVQLSPFLLLNTKQNPFPLRLSPKAILKEFLTLSQLSSDVLASWKADRGTSASFFPQEAPSRPVEPYFCPCASPYCLSQEVKVWEGNQSLLGWYFSPCHRWICIHKWFREIQGSYAAGAFLLAVYRCWQ